MPATWLIVSQVTKKIQTGQVTNSEAGFCFLPQREFPVSIYNWLSLLNAHMDGLFGCDINDLKL